MDESMRVDHGAAVAKHRSIIEEIPCEAVSKTTVHNTNAQVKAQIDRLGSG
jgi:hypothetical protein